MKERWNYVLYLIWFSYLVLSAVIMFGHGFLLSRKTLSDLTECVPLHNFNCNGKEKNDLSVRDYCTDDEKMRQILSNSSNPLVCVPNKNRVVFLLVDALRYDFTEYDGSILKPLAYQNRIPVMRQTLDKWPDRTRLFRFMADPPTTTLQRVKALVTGSLPTFIDISSNFAAMELQEDNVIDQVVKSGGRAVLLGDDTWGRLIPGRWLRSHALYSFHTWDLDTVDKGHYFRFIMKHSTKNNFMPNIIDPKLNDKSIAEFTKLQHCLILLSTEVDSKIYDELMKDDWDLLVAHYLGVDHAGHRYGPNHPEMTRKLNETNTRLEKILEILPSDVILYVVGDHGMTENGDHGGESKAERTAALFAYRKSGFAGDISDITVGKEVQQTDLAPSMSAALGRPPPAPSLGNLLLPILPKYSIPQNLLHISNNLKQIMQYLVRYGEESQQISLDKLAQLINATGVQIERAADIKTNEELTKYVTDVRALIDNIRGIFREVWVEFDSLSMLRALLLLLLAIFFNWLITEGIPVERLPNIFASSFVPTGIISMAVCIAVCYTGYYFELLEDVQHAIYLNTGLVSGAVICVLIIMHWDGISQRWYEGRSPFYERFARACLVASAAVLVSNSFVIEEGASLCFLVLSVLGVMAWNIKTIKALVLWLGIGIVLALSRNYRGCREEQGDCWIAGGGAPTGQTSRAALVLTLGSVSAVVAIARRHVGWRGHGLVVAGLLSCAHWAVGWGTLGSPSRSRLLARLAWLVLVVMFILLFVRRDFRNATLPATVCAFLIYVGNSLVMGASYAPSVTLALLSGVLALNIVTLLKNEGSLKFSLSTRCNSSVACMWALLASYQFYGTGHHATIGHVRWAPAFHAGDPNYLPVGPYITGVLVSLDLFGMPFMFGVALPLLTLWGRNDTAAGPRTQLAAVFALALKFSLCFALRVFACAFSATIHCRHLMIWGVFTPKLLFEGGACAAAFLGAIIGSILTTWHLPLQNKSS